MSRALLLSIKPKWVSKILNGEKTIEVRKSKPKCDLPIDVYIYCTKEEYLYRTNKGYFSSKKPLEVGKGTDYSFAYSDEGKVVAKFTLNKVEEIYFENHKSIYCDDPLYPETDSLSYDELLDKSCTKALPYGETEIGNYIGEKGYAWHISNLVIFNRPRELSDFKHCTEKTCVYGKCHKYMHCLKPLTKAPQSWRFIEAVGDK